MVCPTCKNPVNSNDTICEWCGNQLTTLEQSILTKKKNTLINFVRKLPKKRKYLLAFISIVILFFIYNNSSNKNDEITDKITPENWQEKRAFDYLTMVRYKIINKSDSFENLALKHSQDTLSISHKGMEVNIGELGDEFDEMVSKLEVNQLSEIFEIKDGNVNIKQYAIMKLLAKGNGFYKLQYITRNINLEIGQYYQGGIIVQLDDNFMHGLITSEKDLQGTCGWYRAMEDCKSLKLNGYDNWRLPSATELNSLYNNKNEIGGFHDDYYWSYEGTSGDDIYVVYFGNGASSSRYRSRYFRVRAVRSF
jgi:hypothetical protein